MPLVCLSFSNYITRCLLAHTTPGPHANVQTQGTVIYASPEGYRKRQCKSKYDFPQQKTKYD